MAPPDVVDGVRVTSRQIAITLGLSHYRPLVKLRERGRLSPVGPIYEVVSGQIMLAKRDDFFRLHRSVLLPIMVEVGIRPHLLLLTELGRYGKFLDIYAYPDLATYERLTDQLLAHPAIPAYYQEVGGCISGSITVEIMRELPYFRGFTSG